MRLKSCQHVSLSLLKSNYQNLRKIAPHQNILFMVKANAYGHGACEIVEFSIRELVIFEFGVATLQEALFLRDELSDLKFDIYVFSDLFLLNDDYYHHYSDKRIIPVITKMSELDFVLSQKKLINLPLCLKFNTGMNRLGFQEESATEIIAKLLTHKREIYHFMTHVACAGQSLHKNKRNVRQVESFKSLKQAFSEAGVSIKYSSFANSGVLEQGGGLDETHIRPGLLLYGPSSLRPNLREKSLCKTQIISQLYGEVLHVFDVERGEPIGYGATPVPIKGRVAIISLGYGDGVSQSYRGTKVNFNGSLGAIFGRVTMDMTYILFPDDAKVTTGDTVSLWGHSRDDFHKMSDEQDISSYEIFCQISPRIRKLYKS